MNFNTFRAKVMFTGLAFVAFGLLFTLSGCGKKNEQEPVSFATLEDARTQARANAEFNAQQYRVENPRFTTHKLVSHGDSTQTNACPQGDGWATLNLINTANGVVTDKITVKCSTVSAALGCYKDDDFVKKPFASDEGHCQATNKVPFPLPKVGGK
jgi:hypothetical protein